MKNLYTCIILIIVLGCQSLEKPEPPQNLISEDQMVTILTDIALVKSAKSSFKKKLEINKINPEAYILNKYKIDSVTFTRNNEWYAYDLKKYEKIFEKVKTNIEEKRSTVEKLKKEQDSIKKIEDSIQKMKKQQKDSLTNLK